MLNFSLYIIWLPYAILKFGIKIIKSIAFYTVIGLIVGHIYLRAYPPKDMDINDIDE